MLLEECRVKRTRMSRAAPEDRGRIGDLIRFQWMKLTSTVLRSQAATVLVSGDKWPLPQRPIPKNNDLFWLTDKANNGLLSIIIRARVEQSPVCFVLWEGGGPTGLPVRYEWLSSLQPEIARAIMGDRFEIDHPEVLAAINSLVYRGSATMPYETNGVVVASQLTLLVHEQGLGGC